MDNTALVEIGWDGTFTLFLHPELGRFNKEDIINDRYLGKTELYEKIKPYRKNLTIALFKDGVFFCDLEEEKKKKQKEEESWESIEKDLKVYKEVTEDLKLYPSILYPFQVEKQKTYTGQFSFSIKPIEQNPLLCGITSETFIIPKGTRVKKSGETIITEAFYMV